MISRKRWIKVVILTACCSLPVVQGRVLQHRQQRQRQQASPAIHPLRPQSIKARRTMDNRDQQREEHRHRRRYNDYAYNYYTQKHQEKNSNGSSRWRTEQTEASLSDVWLCYAFALGWSMWFLSSFLNTDLMRFAESESVLVHGNVREVSIEDDSLGTGIPTYQ